MRIARASIPCSLGLLLLGLPSLAWGRIHAPHDNVYGVATAPLADGRSVVVATSELRTVRLSRDGMLSWEILTGEGLEDARAVAVSWNPDFPNQYGEQGAFLIGAENGIWVHETGAPPDTCYALQNGLGSGNGASFRHLVTPQGNTANPRPTFALAKNGTLYRLRPDWSGWDAVHSLDTPANYGGLAVAQDWDPAAGGRAATVFAASDSQLWRSENGGDPGSWSLVLDAGALGWGLGAVALEWDYATNPQARVLLGLGRAAATASGDEGEIRVSDDGGLTWTTVLTLPTSVTALAAVPPGPTAPAAVFAAGRQYPGASGFEETGVLRSDDHGQTWQDFDNWQCFLREHDPGTFTGYPPLRYWQQLHVAHDYATSGRLLWARNEGLYLSEDEGITWIQRFIRHPSESRRIGSGLEPGGSLVVHAATYGSGPVSVDVDQGQEYAAQDGTGWLYLRSLGVSPDFANDGAVFFGAAGGMYGWFDPDLPPANVTGRTGLVRMPLMNAQTGETLVNNIRFFGMSPTFSALAGSPDQVLYFTGWAGNVWRSLDAGLTYEEVNAAAQGVELGEFFDIVVAPGFNPVPPHSDIYGISFGAVYRLQDDVWQLLLSGSGTLNDLELHPDFNTNGNRTMWIALDQGGRILELDDQPGGLVVSDLAGGGLPEATRVTALDARRDLQGELWLYAATFSRGIFRKNLDQGGAWEALPMDGMPSLWIQSMELAADWEISGRVLAGTSRGAWILDETAATPAWTPVFDFTFVDDFVPQAVTWSGPADPNPADPSQPWPWLGVPGGRFPEGSIGEEGATYTKWDGARLQADGLARRVEIRTASGPGTATVDLSLTDLETGAVLSATTVDLGALSQAAEETFLQLDPGLSEPRPVRLEVEVRADPGEVFAWDWLRFQR